MLLNTVQVYPDLAIQKIAMLNSNSRSNNESNNSGSSRTNTNRDDEDNSSVSEQKLTKMFNNNTQQPNELLTLQSKHNFQESLPSNLGFKRIAALNSKKLSLDLNGISNNDAVELFQSPIKDYIGDDAKLPFNRLSMKDRAKQTMDLRHKISRSGPLTSKPSALFEKKLTRRRTTLLLTIPPQPKTSIAGTFSDSVKNDFSYSAIDNTNNKNKTQIPIIKQNEFADSQISANNEKPTMTIKKNNNTSGSNLLTNNNLSTQTILQDFSKMSMGDDFDENKANAYPNGPLAIYKDQLYLYSEPNLQDVKLFDVVINVAKEVIHPFSNGQISDYSDESKFKLFDETLSNLVFERIEEDDNDKDDKMKTKYFYVPWTHNSALCNDFPLLMKIIEGSIDKGEKVLIHCQCGVSRSASLVIAYIIKTKKMPISEAYEYVKSKATDISPNMSLIFQLVEWADNLGLSGNKNSKNSSSS